jgi:hypothetical protein
MTPAWADTMLKTAQIGNHVFYRWAPRVHAPVVTGTTSLETNVAVEVPAGSAPQAREGI